MFWKNGCVKNKILIVYNILKILHKWCKCQCVSGELGGLVCGKFLYETRIMRRFHIILTLGLMREKNGLGRVLASFHNGDLITSLPLKTWIVCRFGSNPQHSRIVVGDNWFGSHAKNKQKSHMMYSLYFVNVSRDNWLNFAWKWFVLLSFNLSRPFLFPSFSV